MCIIPHLRRLVNTFSSTSTKIFRIQQCYPAWHICQFAACDFAASAQPSRRQAYLQTETPKLVLYCALLNHKNSRCRQSIVRQKTPPKLIGKRELWDLLVWFLFVGQCLHFDRLVVHATRQLELQINRPKNSFGLFVLFLQLRTEQSAIILVISNTRFRVAQSMCRQEPKSLVAYQFGW